MAEPAIPIEDPNRELPKRAVVSVETESRSNPRLNEAAGAIGGAVGSAVEEVRRLPARLEVMKERFTVIRGRAQDGAASKAADLKRAARERAHEARSRAAYYAREYPLHVIAAVAGAGFALGIALRIWRSTRA